MRPAARFIAAGVVAAALGTAPGFAQTAGTDPSGSSAQGTSTSTQGTQPSTSTASSTSSGGVDEAAAREHLSQARQALADLTKLPAAGQLQGEPRTAVSNLIQAFNALATATTDWRSRFQVVSEQLDQILASDTAGGATGTAGASSTGASGTSPAGSTATPGSAPGAASGGYDPTIIAKLREVRTHLDAFQEASGDPTPHFDAIEKIIDEALSGTSGSSTVGTSGSTASATGSTGDASASGTVSVSRAQLEEIRQHVAKLRAAAQAAANRK